MSDKLLGVHPVLIAKVQAIIAAMGELGFVMLVTDGVRTVQDQQRLFAQGRTAPGRIVTQADGVENRSNHQPHADGLGHAVDMTFVGPGGHPIWDDLSPWNLYGEMCKALGLRWGGDDPAFIAAHMIDRPHLELP